MRRLWLRLAVSLAGLTLIGLSLVDVAFIAWARDHVRRERSLAVRAAASEAAVALELRRRIESWPTSSPPESTRAVLLPIAAFHGVVLSAIDAAGARSSTADVPLPAEIGGQPVVHLGWEHVGVLAADHRVIASFPFEDVTERVLALQRQALPVLAIAGFAMIFFGLAFLRRSVLAPIARMTEGVGALDGDALERLATAAGSDDLLRLGRAIVAMRLRIDTDRARIADQLAALQTAHGELTAAQTQLVRAERLAVVGQLAAGLAHEVGNPLTVVGGYVAMLFEQLEKGEPLSGREVKDALARAQHELDRIQATVRSLLDFSRAREAAAGRGEVGEALDHVRRLMQPQDRLRGIALAIVPPAGPLHVTLASDALTQVLVNLLLNAADAIKANRDAGRIAVHTEAADGAALIRVDDDGPGIPPDVLPRIFEPFFTTKPAGHGTGLGLSVCERIVTSAGGDLRVESSPMGGARFTIAVPRSPAR